MMSAVARSPDTPAPSKLGPKAAAKEARRAENKKRFREERRNPALAVCGGRTKKKEGGSCQRPAGWGTDHPGVGRCRYHAGQAGGPAIAARVATARALGAPWEISPSEAMLWLVHRAAGDVRYWDAQVAALDEEDLHGRPVRVTDREGEIEIVHYPEAMHILVTQREQSMDRLQRYVKDALALGIAERQVALAESAAAILSAVIGPILRELGVFDDPRAPEIVEREVARLEMHYPDITMEAKPT